MSKYLQEPLLESQIVEVKSKKNYFSLLFLWEAMFYMKKGQKEIIQPDMIKELNNNQRTIFLYQTYKLFSKRHSFKKALFKTFQFHILKIWILVLLLAFAQLSIPLLVQTIIEYIEQDNKHIGHGLFLVFLLIIARFINLFCVAHSKVQIQQLGYNWTTIIQMELYQKMLRVSFQSNNKFSEGQVINLMQVDATKQTEVCYEVAGVLQFPIQIIFGIILAYYIIGVAFLGGLVAIIFTGVVNSILSKYYSTYQTKIMKEKDERIKATNECLNQIKFIKSNALEQMFEKNLNHKRELELKQIYKKAFTLSIIVFFNWFCPALIQISTFFIYIQLGNELTPSETFAIISLFTMLEDPLMILPQSINSLIQAIISLNRCGAFIETKELDLERIEYKQNNQEIMAIEIKNGNFSWKPREQQESVKPTQVINQEEDEQLILKDIDIKIKKGEFIIIVGDVGSGKSSLLQCLLGEMLTSKQSQVKVNGTMSFVGQKSWIMNDTVRNNIIFGQEYDEKKYQQVIQCCCLVDDLKILQSGDLTVIGEKGVNLSGGQKARISLARAVYSESDIYLLDDPISAVDPHVAELIMEECLRNHLNGKTRLLITHALNNCHFADQIYLISNGTILEHGPFNEISLKPQFQEIFNKYHDTEDNDELELEEETIKLQKRQSSLKVSSQEEKENIIIEEDREEGELKSQVLNAFYESNGGAIGLVITVGIQIIGISVYTFSVIWMGKWSEESTSQNNNYYLKIYIYLGLGQALFAFLRNYSLCIQNILASKKIHAQMLNVLYSSICQFFERVPLGRILNRFTKDLDVIDSELYPNLSYFYIISTLTISDIFLLVFSSTTFIIIPIFLFIGICIKIQRYYMRVSREVYRIDAITKSPILSFFTESIQGVSVIRAFNKQADFIQDQAKRQDLNRKIFYAKNLCTSWFILVLGLSSYIVNLSAIMFCIFYGQNHPSYAGLILVFAAYLDRDVSQTISITGQIENNLVSFERCLSLSTNEREEKIQNQSLTPNWPSQGQVQFQNMSVKYRPNLPLVLKNITLTINPKEKIGVVGRTGAGKSSVTMSLLRHIEACEGQILIDGIDIADLTLQQLRQSITLIMQDPTIFRGSLRSNLDPFCLLDDQQIIEVLSKCCLDNLMNKGGLEFQIDESGSNLSAGEKQLVCIARAILKNSKLVLIDEATANIDIQTEQQIQTTIKEQFKDCTVITIAHRINTIMHCDKILVIDQGQVKEFGQTQELIKQKDSLFYSIYTQALKQRKQRL